MKPTENQKARLQDLGTLADGDIDLTETALMLAAMEHPRVSLEPYRRHLARLTREVGGYAADCRSVYSGSGNSRSGNSRSGNSGSGNSGSGNSGAGGGLDLKVEALRQVIVKRYGYDGSDDAFDDTHSVNLMRVIDRRRGLPVMLGLIYMHVAKHLGWPMAGIDFPGRFLIRLEGDGERVILDPFGGGRTLAPKDLRGMLKGVAGNEAELSPDLYQPMSCRDIVLRIVNNVKVDCLKAERLGDALDCIETMLLFAPEVAFLWREAGLLNARLDQVPEAVVALEEFLRLEPGREAGNIRASALLQELRGRLG